MAHRPAGTYFYYFFHTQAGSGRAWPAARQEAKEAPEGEKSKKVKKVKKVKK